MHEELVQGIVDLKRDEVADLVKKLTEQGEDPNKILDECKKGMTIVSDKFQAGDFYLAELLLSAEIFKKAMIFLEPHLAKDINAESAGTVLLATLKGDIHDLGKDILGFLLKAQGFEVHDMGVDVMPDKFIEKVKEVKPDLVGFSALITLTFDRMKEAEEMLVKEGLRDTLRIMIGGGVTTPGIKDYVRADFQTIDAMEGVSYCVNTMKGD